MDLYLVRHGETDWNRERRLQGRTDVPLNARGRAQAAAAAHALHGRSVGAVTTSPLARAAETGRIVAAVLGVALAGTDDRLVERSYGAKEGLRPDEVALRFPAGRSVPGLEDVDAVRRRVLPALDAVVAAASGRTAVVVTTHGAVVRAVVTAVAPGVADTLDTPIRNGSVHHFRWDPAAASRTLVEWDLPVAGQVPVTSAT